MKKLIRKIITAFILIMIALVIISFWYYCFNIGIEVDN